MDLKREQVRQLIQQRPNQIQQHIRGQDRAQGQDQGQGQGQSQHIGQPPSLTWEALQQQLQQRFEVRQARGWIVADGTDSSVAALSRSAQANGSVPPVHLSSVPPHHHSSVPPERLSSDSPSTHSSKTDGTPATPQPASTLTLHHSADDSSSRQRQGYAASSSSSAAAAAEDVNVPVVVVSGSSSSSVNQSRRSQVFPPPPTELQPPILTQAFGNPTHTAHSTTPSGHTTGPSVDRSRPEPSLGSANSSGLAAASTPADGPVAKEQPRSHPSGLPPTSALSSSSASTGGRAGRVLLLPPSTDSARDLDSTPGGLRSVSAALLSLGGGLPTTADPTGPTGSTGRTGDPINTDADGNLAYCSTCEVVFTMQSSTARRRHSGHSIRFPDDPELAPIIAHRVRSLHTAIADKKRGLAACETDVHNIEGRVEQHDREVEQLRLKRQKLSEELRGGQDKLQRLRDEVGALEVQQEEIFRFKQKLPAAPEEDNDQEY